jgi:hypothetical protein
MRWADEIESIKIFAILVFGIVVPIRWRRKNK